MPRVRLVDFDGQLWNRLERVRLTPVQGEPWIQLEQAWLMTGLSADLRTAVVRWIAADPHPGDRAQLQRLLADSMGQVPGAVDELAARMRPLTFGTAGLRGPLFAGPGGMNLAVVRRTAAGLAAYLWASTHQLAESLPAGPGVGRLNSLALNANSAAPAAAASRSEPPAVVIGFDARRRSEEFARESAAVLAAAGFSVLLAPSALPTPVTAFAVRRLGAVAGVQITASHNPPEDNGIKVYLRGGSQIVPPDDARIESAIAGIGPATSINVSGTPGSWPVGMVEDYVAAASAVGGALTVPPVRIAATALHGVGGAILRRALNHAGFPEVEFVAEQLEPDGAFPTVRFPNPEEPGAADLLLQLADTIGADLAIANDPDADRVAIGARFPDGWRMLSGDETGALLGNRVLRSLDRSVHPDPLVATTIVSSTQLASIAAAYGARYAETLTGFKWIVRAGDGSGTGLVYAYEEALGHCVDPDVVRDKDGISAAVLAAKLTAELKAAGRTVPEALDQLARRYGLHVTDQLSVRVRNVADIAAAMSRLRAAPPVALLGDTVAVTDLLPLTDALVFRTGRLRVVVRPSGTEPKLKCYFEITSPVPDQDITTLRASAREELALAKHEMSTVLGLV